MNLTLQTKNIEVFANQPKSEIATRTWDSSQESWDNAQGTWDNPVTQLTNQSKNTTSFTNQTKN